MSHTLHQDVDEHYVEHVFHVRLDGHVYGVLLCLGRGPRSFCPVYLHGNQTQAGRHDDVTAGWYVYMRDGHDGVIGVRLYK